MDLPLIVVPLSAEFYYKIQMGDKYEIKDSEEKVIKYLKERRYSKVILGKMGTKTLAEKLSQSNIEYFYS